MEQELYTTIVFVLAHPDDESFLPAGTIAKYSSEGVRVIYICATRGENGRGCVGGHRLPPDSLKIIRYQELEKACSTLGITELYELDYPDGHLRELNPSEPIKRLVTFFRVIKPHVVVTFDPTGISNHHDHITIHRWVTQAFRLCNNPFYKTAECDIFLPGKLYYLAIPSNHMISISNSKERERYESLITTSINVSQYLEKKRQAILCHKTQSFNIRRIFKFAGGTDNLEKYEYYILAQCNLKDYSYEVIEDDILGGIRKKTGSKEMKMTKI